MKKLFAAMLLVGVTHAQVKIAAPLGLVKEGLYFQQNGYGKTILELKGGQFRYWYDSDAPLPGEITKYPLTGAYATNGGEVTIVVTKTCSWDGIDERTNLSHFPRTNRWTFVQYKGQPTLWHSDVWKNWETMKTSTPGGVLFPSEKKPEDLWASHWR